MLDIVVDEVLHVGVADGELEEGGAGGEGVLEGRGEGEERRALVGSARVQDLSPHSTLWWSEG